jgi:hypothetical protein
MSILNHRMTPFPVESRMANARDPKTNHEFFNTAAFVPQPTGTNGNEVRGSLFGPDFRHVDLSIFKDFR